jgi:hypothetical protein
LLVLHRCDNGPCRNLDHLFLGTQSDNIRDCRDKGRLASPIYAIAKARRKLTTEDVASIRAIRLWGESYRAIAAMFGVDPKTIWQVVNGRTYL